MRYFQYNFKLLIFFFFFNRIFLIYIHLEFHIFIIIFLFHLKNIMKISYALCVCVCWNVIKRVLSIIFCWIHPCRPRHIIWFIDKKYLGKNISTIRNKITPVNKLFRKILLPEYWFR